MMAKGKRGSRFWGLVVILLLAFALRIYRLGAESLWYDETVSVYLAGNSVPALVAHTAGDIHPPGYYLLLHAWTRLAGSSDFAAAFPSLFFGMLLVALAYWLGTRIFGSRAGLLAAFLVTISPYNIWYSQEVRMYTLGAALGMGVLCAVVSLLAPIRLSRERKGVWPWLGAYALCGAMGLWALYYFAFLLIAINLMVGVWWLVARRRRNVGRAWLGRWILAQFAVLVLYAPWIPVAWRQATEPPVPPWRGMTALGPTLVEAWSALSLGQSVEPSRVWPVLLLFAVLLVLGLFHRKPGGEKTTARFSVSSPAGRRAGAGAVPWGGFLAGYVFLPVFLIYLASFITPLYHVRYAFTYSTPFYVLVGAGLASLWERWRLLAGLSLGVLVLFSGISLYNYHTDPRYASDDHRAAVEYLSAQWRPGDAILVNAGYAYTALLTYWDDASTAPWASIIWRGRLVDYPGRGAIEGSSTDEGTVVLQTGTIDGDPSLGWGEADSDFYAMSRAETEAALERLFADFERVWVYRIYDTVADPDGFVRGWLAEHGTQFEDQVFTGEAQLRVQGFLTGRDPQAGAGQPIDETLVDGSLRLVAASSLPPAVEVGGALDLALVWEVASPLDSMPPGEDPLLFAGLFDDSGRRWAQTDERPLGTLYPVSAWPEGALVRVPLQVPFLPGTPPGRYRLEVGWYTFVDGQPVWLPWTSGERLVLGEVEVLAPRDWSVLPVPEVAYPAGVEVGDGVQFLGFDALLLQAYPGEAVHLDLYWQALHDMPEPGLVVLQLVDDSRHVLAEASGAPVGGRAPFAGLEAGQVVRDPRSFTLPGDLAPGVYNLSLGRRGSGGGWLPVRRGSFPLGETYPLVTVRALGRPLDLTSPQVQEPVNAEFGAPGSDATIRLVGYDLQPPAPNLQSRTPGLQLTLYWQALAPMVRNYKVFVHLVGEGGPSDIRAQADVYPYLPTMAWVPGEYLRDQVVVDLPGELAPGRYVLLMGVYDEATGERLPATAESGHPLGDDVLLQEFRLEE